MVSSDRQNDLVTSQVKLEGWVTPHWISLMDAGDTEGKPLLLQNLNYFTSYDSTRICSHRSFLTNLPQTPPHLQQKQSLQRVSPPFFIELRSFEALITWHSYYFFRLGGRIEGIIDVFFASK